MLNDKPTPMENSPEPTTTTTPQVLVIGAGLGGLCLAQGLTKAGIGVEVFERDASAQVRRQGYRLGLKEGGARALHECLPENLFDLAVSTSLRPATRMVFTDEQLNPKFDKPLPEAAPGPAGLGVNRLTLREILLAGLAGVVHFGKAFHHYEQFPGGGIRAHFTDGGQACADLLVGADGTNSAVRRLLLPTAVLDDLHWSVYGRTPITERLLAQIPDVLVDTFNRVIGPGGTAVAVATCRTIEPVADAVARLAPGVQVAAQPDYFSWTMPLSDERFHDADAATLHRLAGDLVDGWHPAVRAIVGHADVPATFPILVRSARPVEPWDNAEVTLLGDAVHTMSPGRGDGAGIALQDAQLLCRAVTEVAAGRVSQSRAMAGYQAEMLGYGFQAVADSLRSPFAPPSRAGS